jgi:hypothetical protein
MNKEVQDNGSEEDESDIPLLLREYLKLKV